MHPAGRVSLGGRVRDGAARLLAARLASGAAEEGSVTVFAALVMVILLAMAGLGVDMSRGRQYVVEAQTAANAAALAGAQDLLATTFPGWPVVVSDVKTYADENFNVPQSAWNGCQDAFHMSYLPDNVNGDTCISTNAVVNASAIRVLIPSQRVPTAFARVVGLSSLNVTAWAEARTITSPPCGLCLLSPNGTALSAIGNAAITVNVENVIVDSTANIAANLNGNATVVATKIGGPAAPGGFLTSNNAYYSPPPENLPPVPDPLAAVVACPAVNSASPCPTATVSDIHLSGSQSQTITPGIYGNIEASGQASLTMSPGTYVITGNLSFSGNGGLVANGVTMYFACAEYPTPCAKGESGGSFSISGNGSTSISPPTSGPYQGLTIFSDRNNATTSDTLVGNGGTLLTGTLYAKAAGMTMKGNAGTTAINSLVITNTVSLTGNGTLTLTFNVSQNAPVGTVELTN